jgi:hypothetical protein
MQFPRVAAKRRIESKACDEEYDESPPSSPVWKAYDAELIIGPSLEAHSTRLLKQNMLFRGQFAFPFHFESDRMNPLVIEPLRDFAWTTHASYDQDIGFD